MAIVLIWTFVAILMGALAWCIRGLHANEVTGRQRQALVAAIFDPVVSWSYERPAEEFWAVHSLHKSRLRAYQAISYEQHLRAIMLFRNPWKLYGPEIEQLMGGLQA